MVFAVILTNVLYKFFVYNSKSSMAIAPRDYQLECLKTVINEYYSRQKRKLISLPTLSGKTIIMAAIA